MVLSIKSQWRYGEKAELAKRSGVSVQHLNSILRGGTVARAKARKLVMIAHDMNKDVTYLDFIDSDITVNPLFKNKYAIKNLKRLTDV